MVGWLGARFGDYRYANAVATTLAGALMAYSRPSRLATTAAAVFWFSPRLLFVIEQGWTEPQVIFLFAATVFAACRSPRLLPLALGFLFAAKQYTILFAPFAFLLLPRPTLRGYAVLVVEAAAIATAITLPWALWNWRAFFGAVIALQFKQPFRPDALSYLAWRAANGAPTLPLSMNLLVFVPTAAAALVRAARTPAGFSGACALGLIVFVAFAKQAFCNYYMLVIGLLCIATATALIEPPSAADTASRRTA
jgi:hypothetical protein